MIYLNLSNESSKMVAHFLQQNQTYYLREWERNILVDKTDINREKIRENGSLMYNLVLATLTESLSEEKIKQLAYKVAKERVEANINIGDFIYNVNLGRSIIIKCVIQSDICKEDLSQIVDMINKQFDSFCFHAVTRYTELKNRELQEKNSYINQTHKDRLALLGQMSSSFVHEFRNPLTSVIGFVKLLRTDYPTLKYLDIIDLELDQLKFRITQFLHTSKMNVIVEERVEDVSLKILLNEIIEFLYPSIVDRDVSVLTNIDEDAIITVNKAEWKQVFLNILMNSIDAVTQNNHKREVTVSCFSIDEQNIIKISNNGPAIPNETKDTIFEPFFTTKDLGTGIGLYVCKNIVEKYNGTITCDSDEQLTTFEISLPCNPMPKENLTTSETS